MKEMTYPIIENTLIIRNLKTGNFVRNGVRIEVELMIGNSPLQIRIVQYVRDKVSRDPRA
jgi:hypothetical protein